MAEPLLRVENLMRRFGGIVATDHLSLDVAKGELHAITGPHGAVKTTSSSQITGHVAPDCGTIEVGPLWTKLTSRLPTADAKLLLSKSTCAVPSALSIKI